MAEAIMTIEDHTQSCASATKKLKQKKVPQRGLGVAQLERIRLEEQHIKDETLHSPNVLSPNSIVSTQDSTLKPKLNSSSIPTQTLLLSKNCDSRPNSSRTTGMIGEDDMNLSAILGTGYMDRAKLWSSEDSPEEENKKLYQYGGGGDGGVQPNLNLSHEPQTPIFSLPNVLHRSQQYQQPPCSSSMVNISSSARNLQMEPPSNQSYHGCHYLPLWPEEVKMVGIKRPYPFPPEYPPVPAFQKFPPCYIAPVFGSHESASYSNICIVNSESGTLHKREVPLKSRTLSEAKPRNVVRGNRALNGDFLTLAPPTAVGNGNQQDLSNSALQNSELFKFETVPFQEVAEEPSTKPGLNRFVQQPVFRFFPSANVQIGHAGITKSNCQGEVGGKVDLNLKL